MFLLVAGFISTMSDAEVYYLLLCDSFGIVHKTR